jgi:hypothetical protein
MLRHDCDAVHDVQGAVRANPHARAQSEAAVRALLPAARDKRRGDAVGEAVVKTFALGGDVVAGAAHDRDEGFGLAGVASRDLRDGVRDGLSAGAAFVERRVVARDRLGVSDATGIGASAAVRAGERRRDFVIRELIELRARFGVSIMGIMKRAEQLNIIDQRTAKGFWIYTGKMKWRANGEPGIEKFVPYNDYEKPMRFKQLVWRAVSENVISLSKGAVLLKQDIDSFRRELREMI